MGETLVDERAAAWAAAWAGAWAAQLDSSVGNLAGPSGWLDSTWAVATVVLKAASMVVRTVVLSAALLGIEKNELRCELVVMTAAHWAVRRAEYWAVLMVAWDAM